MVAGSSLDQRVGGYMSGDGGHGAHGGSRGAHGHKGFHEMDSKEFLDKARGVHDSEHHDYIKDREKRAEEVEKIHKEYTRHKSRIEDELGKAIEDKFDFKKVEGLHKKIQDAYAHTVHGSEGTRKGLNKKQREKHLKELLEVLLPDMGYNLPDKDALYNFFMRNLDQLKNDKMYGQIAGGAHSELEEALKTGDAYTAAEKVKELMKLQVSSQYQQEFNEAIINRDDKEFAEAYAGRVVKTVKEKTGKELNEALIRANLISVLGDYLHGNYGSILREHGKTKEPEHGHGAAHH